MEGKLFKVAYILLIIVFAVSWFKIRELPPKSGVAPNLLNEPIQTETNREDFTFDYRGKNYHVKPLADYRLWGLVVTQNDIQISDPTVSTSGRQFGPPGSHRPIGLPPTVVACVRATLPPRWRCQLVRSHARHG